MVFSCKEAALEVQMSVSPSVSVSVTKLKLGMHRVMGYYKGTECAGDGH